MPNNFKNKGISTFKTLQIVRSGGNVSLEKRILYFNLIPQKSIEDVGGWSNIHKMGMAVGVVWDSLDRDYFIYKEKDSKILLEKFRTSDLVAGFGISSDYTVLQPYSDFDMQEISTFDITHYIKKNLGYRISLGHLVKCNLGEEIDRSLDSFDLCKKGSIDQAIEIEKKYVGLVRDLHLFGCENGFVKYRDRMGEDQNFPVEWADLSSNVG